MGDDAVSSVIGTVLILAITVGAFGGVAIVVLDAVEESHETPRADIDVQQRGRNFVVLHRGGDSIDASDVDLIVYTDGVATTYSLAASDTDGTWMPGENICIPCIHGVADGVEVIVRHGGSSVAASAGSAAGTGSGGGGSGGSGGSGTPELRPNEITSDVFNPGSAGHFRVTVVNEGSQDADAFDVRFAVDGMPLGDVAVTGLGAGQETLVESPAWTASPGSHTLTVTVDAADAVAEGDESDNALTISYTVASSSGTQAYQDNDQDGHYDPATDQPLTVGPLSAADCSSASCSPGDVGLVIPDPGDGSMPALVIPAGSDLSETSENLYFSAPGNVTIDGNLTTTGGGGGGDIRLESTSGSISLSSRSITNGNGNVVLSAAGDVDVSGAHIETNGNNGDITITSGGHIRANATTMVAETISLQTPNGPAGAIHQDALRLCQSFAAGPGCSQPHIVASQPNDPRATYALSPLFFGTLAEGAWT